MKSKRWIPILLTAWPYIVLGLLMILTNEENQYYGITILLLCVATVVVYVLNLIHACKQKCEECTGLALAGMLIKLLHIPFYLLMFMLGLMVLVIMVVPAFVFISPFLVIMLAIIDFFLMLTSSAYGINALIRAREEGIISSKFMVIHILMHLCFVLDIVSAIVVFIKLKKAKHLKETVL